MGRWMDDGLIDKLIRVVNKNQQCSILNISIVWKNIFSVYLNYILFVLYIALLKSIFSCNEKYLHRTVPEVAGNIFKNVLLTLSCFISTTL